MLMERKIFTRRGGVIRYYLKRIIALFPMYFFVHIVSSFFYGNDMRAVIRLIPIETIGVQAWFDSLFGFVHNGGTWFVSCLLVAYFVYPLLAQILRDMKLEIRVVILVILVGMQIYSLYTISYFGGNIYSSPLFRTVDFTIGVVLCSIRDYVDKKFDDWIYCIISMISAVVLCECFLNRSYWDNFLYVPLGVLLYSVACISCKGEIFKTKIFEISTNIIGYASSLSYAFYILQCILWKPFFEILDRYPMFEENSKRGMLAFGLLFFASLILHEVYEKPLKKVLLKCYRKCEMKKNSVAANER